MDEATFPIDTYEPFYGILLPLLLQWKLENWQIEKSGRTRGKMNLSYHHHHWRVAYLPCSILNNTRGYGNKSQLKYQTPELIVKYEIYCSTPKLIANSNFWTKSKKKRKKRKSAQHKTFVYYCVRHNFRQRLRKQEIEDREQTHTESRSYTSHQPPAPTHTKKKKKEWATPANSVN